MTKFNSAFLVTALAAFVSAAMPTLANTYGTFPFWHAVPTANVNLDMHVAENVDGEAPVVCSLAESGNCERTIQMRASILTDCESVTGQAS